MNNYSIVAGNQTQEAYDAMWLIHGMYYKFLTSQGYAMQPQRPNRVMAGGGMMPRMDQIDFETDADLDKVCGYYRVCRTSPYDAQGRRHTVFPCLIKEGVDKRTMDLKAVVSIVLNPYQRIAVPDKKELDILGDDVTKVLRGELMPWLTLKEQ